MKICNRSLTLGAILLLGACNTESFSWVTHTWTTDYGVFALDHVSRRRVEITTPFQRGYLGETYYFESEQNARVFDSNPWAYLYTDNVHLQSRPDRMDQN
jgi:YHS domain-containing protein